MIPFVIIIFTTPFLNKLNNQEKFYHYCLLRTLKYILPARKKLLK
jgi:hypothetical protein